MSKAKDERSVTTTVRLPEDMHDDLKQLAKAENRSLHKQILYALRVFLVRRKTNKDRTEEKAGTR